MCTWLMKLALLSVCIEAAVMAECEDSRLLALLALLIVLLTEPPPGRPVISLACVDSCMKTKRC